MAAAAFPSLLARFGCAVIILTAALAPVAHAEDPDAALKKIGASMRRAIKGTFSGGAASPLPDAAVIEYFFPKSIEFALGENCTKPAEEGTSKGVAVYHAGPHPKNPNVVMVTYALMFKRDCGHAGHQGALGVAYHKGDIEFFHYTLKKDSTCSQGWRLHAIKTVAHGGEFGRREINEKIVNSCEPPDHLVSSLGKHALYLSWLDCTKRTPAEVCLKGFEADFTLYDVGSSAETGPDLSAYFGSTDTLWNNDGHFCGGVNVDNRKTDCISFDADKIVNPGNYLKDIELPDPDLGGSGKCPYGSNEEAGLCYKKCDDGYKGFATMCIPGCPSGYRDDGLYCAKPKAYGRGAGYPVHVLEFNDKGMYKRCEADHGSGNCEKSGLIVYPKCKEGYKAFGCCVCTPECPAGMTDIGVSCQKKTYDRGAGVLP